MMPSFCMQDRQADHAPNTPRLGQGAATSKRQGHQKAWEARGFEPSDFAALSRTRNVGVSTLQQAVQGQPGMEWVNPIRTGIKKVRDRKSVV